MTVTIMAAVARNGVIGRGGAIPWHLPDDMTRFRQLTMGHVLVMGRLTYESIGRPLPGRTTIVVTRNGGWPEATERPAGLVVATSLEEALREAGRLGSETFIQGGAQVYAEALPLADRLLVTWVDADPAGDTYFPDVDWSAWDEVDRKEFDGGAWSTYRRRTDGKKPAS
ncbi:MAG: dihydrofolate reductase [Nocardioidaceae bacterium]|jgi:dihydrofolate reductase|nr:dihydrofolate reductase [Nocardioidaceae bacterium]